MARTMYGTPVFVVVDSDQRPMAVCTTEYKADMFIEYLKQEYKEEFTRKKLPLDPEFKPKSRCVVQDAI